MNQEQIDEQIDKLTYKTGEKLSKAILDAIREENIARLNEIFDEYQQSVNYSFLGMSLLGYAASEGALESCKLLVSLGCSIDRVISDTANTPLAEAAYYGHLEVAKWLIDHGAKIDGRPESAGSPLGSAIYFNHLEIVTLLVKHGADIDRLQAGRMQTPLDIARVYRHKEIAEYLQQCGAISSSARLELKGVENASVLLDIWRNAGEILQPKFTQTIHNIPVDLRVGLLDTEQYYKLLFTSGLYQLTPRIEFIVCIHFRWPVNSELVESHNNYGFFMALLYQLSEYAIVGNNVTEGFQINRSDTTKPWSTLRWPIDIDGFIVVDYPFSKNAQSSDDLSDCPMDNANIVTLYALIPIKYPKTGPYKGKKLTDWIEKRKQLKKWSQIAYKPEEAVFK